MTKTLQELTAGATSWPADTLRHVKEALAEIGRLREREAAQLLRRSEPTDADLVAFNQWLSEHADAAKVEVQRAGDQGNGLVAREELPAGGAFIAIPYGVILGVDASLGPKGDASSWNQVAQDPLLTRFPSCLLALRVLSEACASKSNKNKKPPFFKPYIAMLPATFDIPLFYDEADFAAIDGTSLFEPSVKLLYNSIKQFLYLQRLCQHGWPKCPIPTEKFTLSNYFWALGVVLTRQNEVVVGENGRASMALIPGWDMCNHEAGERITTFSDPTKRVVVCHAKRAFAANEPVTMFYGPRTNEQLLVYSGFVGVDNVWDRASVHVRLDADSDPLFKIRRMIILKEVAKDRNIVLTEDSVQVQVGADGSLVSYATLRVLQVLCLTKDNLTKALRSSAAIGADEVFEWSQDERQLAKERFVLACEGTEKQLETFATRAEKCPHGSLFRTYFECQRRAVALGKLNTVVFEAQ